MLVMADRYCPPMMCPLLFCDRNVTPRAAPGTNPRDLGGRAAPDAQRGRQKGRLLGGRRRVV